MPIIPNAHERYVNSGICKIKRKALNVDITARKIKIIADWIRYAFLSIVFFSSSEAFIYASSKIIFLPKNASMLKTTDATVIQNEKNK